MVMQKAIKCAHRYILFAPVVHLHPLDDRWHAYKAYCLSRNLFVCMYQLSHDRAGVLLIFYKTFPFISLSYLPHPYCMNAHFIWQYACAHVDTQPSRFVCEACRYRASYHRNGTEMQRHQLFINVGVAFYMERESERDRTRDRNRWHPYGAFPLHSQTTDYTLR